jgi:hypothetical protein
MVGRVQACILLVRTFAMKTTLLAAVGTYALASLASAQPFEIRWSTIDGGGGTSTGGAFSISGTIGQPDAGTLSGGVFEVRGGYWTGFSGGTPSCPADFNDDGFLDFFDYADYVTCFEDSVCPPGKTADFNGDAFVDFFDYADFVTAFETGC